MVSMGAEMTQIYSLVPTRLEGMSHLIQRNWGRNQQCSPHLISSPTSLEDLAETIAGARKEQREVKVIGAAHSFTSTAMTDGVLVNLDEMKGVISIDPFTDSAGNPAGAHVRVWAGSRIHHLNEALWACGLAFPNLGDFDQQSIAGAISTGTHGTGLNLPSLSAFVTHIQLMTYSGEVIECSKQQNEEIFQAARLSFGSLGVITQVSIRCVPAFALEARDTKKELSECLDSLDTFLEGDHFEFFWLPHTTSVLAKENRRLSAQSIPHGNIGTKPARLYRQFSEQVLENEGFRMLNIACRAYPQLTTAANKLASNFLGSPTYIDRSYRVFASSRRVRFSEMEYAVPIDEATRVLRQIENVFATTHIKSSFPIEVRFVGSDDVWMSTAYQRDVCYIALHQFIGVDPSEYFGAAEKIFRAAHGRPHWGKMHSKDHNFFSQNVKHFQDFLHVRDSLDPQRGFANDYTRSVLGL